jgi:hypothetical protein
MFESRYWKEDLLAHAKRLRPAKKPKRWSERAVVTFEKEVMVSFFMVRALIERGKLSSKVRSHKVLVVRHPWKGKQVTLLNYHDVNDLYDMGDGIEAKVNVLFISNQFIHARAIYAARDKRRNWSHVLLCSDLEKTTGMYSIAVSEIQSIFHLVARDWTQWSQMVYDEALGDYRVTTN